MITAQFSEALGFAADLHRQQVRKGTSIPYISHLLAVSALVLEHGGDEDQAIAALLHDALEDQGASYPGGVNGLREAIRGRFGARVLRLVEGCTDADQHPKPPWLDRKRAYIEHLAEVSDDVLLVSLADKLHNAKSILTDLHRHGESVWARFNAGQEGTLVYYQSLSDIFEYRAFSASPRLLSMTEEFKQVVTALYEQAGKANRHSLGNGSGQPGSAGLVEQALARLDEYAKRH